MKLHVYSPKEKIQFGQYVETPLEVIFKYHPDYIAYLIKEHDDFAIYMEAFKKLPKPTPVRLKNAYELEWDFKKLYLEKLRNSDQKEYVIPEGNELLNLIAEFIREKGYKPPQYEFKFSPEVKNINAHKIELYENYSKPF